jgi:hypothetical protein
MIDDLAYTMNDARYAKDKVALHIPGVDGWKSLAACILTIAPNCRWSNREKAYIVSKRQAERFVQAVNELRLRHRTGGA